MLFHGHAFLTSSSKTSKALYNKKGDNMIPDFGPEADALIKKTCELFPETFALKNFPNETFRVSQSSSYMSGGHVMIYIERRVGNEWLAFSKGTFTELNREIK